MKKILTSLFFASLLFTSCDSFFKGSDVKTELERAIDYANAPAYTISINSANRSGVIKLPAGGEAEKKVSDIFTVSFEPFADHEFLYWKIIDKATDKELENGQYLLLQSLEDSETTCTFVNAPEENMQLCLYPVTVERPQIISYSPLTSGVLKDSSIQVQFDYNMDPASIYYTEEEMKNMITSAAADEGAFEESLDGKKIYKGYKKDGQLYFKNILLKNNRGGENFNGYFDAPVFENANTLTIPRSKDADLEDYVQVLVTIEKGFSYIAQNGKSVEMAGTKKWMYQVNDEVDNSPLSIAPKKDKPAVNQFFVKKNAATADDQAYQPIKNATYPIADINNIKTHKYLLENNCLYLDLRVQETKKGTGPKSTFTMNLKKIADEFYKEVSESESIEIPYTSVTVDDAVFKGSIDFKKLGISDGTYEVSFAFSDRSSTGNTLYYPPRNEDSTDDECFIVVKDNTPPKPIVATGDLKGYLSRIIIECRIEKNINSLDAYYKIDYFDQDGTFIKSYNTEDDCYIEKDKACVFYIFNETGFESHFSMKKEYLKIIITPMDYAGNQNVSYPIELNTRTLIGGMKKVEGGVIEGSQGVSKIFVDNRVVTIPDMWVCDHEITQEEFCKYMTYDSKKYKDGYSNNFSRESGCSFPAYFLTFYDAIMYCNLRSVDEGLEPVYYLQINGPNITDIAQWALITTGNGTGIESTGNAEDGSLRYYYNHQETYRNTILDGIKYNKNADGYRLPTEAEWEYCASGGKKYLTENSSFSGINKINRYYEDLVAWYSINSGEGAPARVHGVQRKNSNMLGLYDMSGNVSEWCWDWWVETSKFVFPQYSKSFTDEGYIYGERDHPIRGGDYTSSFSNGFCDCIVTSREKRYSPSSSSYNIGFRVVRTIFED